MVTSTSRSGAKKAVRRTPTRKAEPVQAIEIPPVVPDPIPGTVFLVLAGAEKQKLVRDSFTIPKDEYEILAALKARMLVLGRAIKKSELIRAGIAALSATGDAELLALLDRVPVIKTGRPSKPGEHAKSGKRKG